MALKIEALPPVRGRYSAGAPLGEAGWFQTGGRAEILFRPADEQDLCDFLAQCPEAVEVSVFGALSNSIIRDGGVGGVVVRLGRGFATVETSGDLIHAGAAALDTTVAKVAAEAGLGGLGFFSGIPGTIGGALRMNAGCYGRETKDVLVECRAVDRRGKIHFLRPGEMGMSYRHVDVPDDYIFTGATFRGQREDPEKIQAGMAQLRKNREDSQPLREKTGGSTFANPSPSELRQAGLPEDTKVWRLIEQAGGRGLQKGGARMSDKHCNFMINTGAASAADLESLGEEIRKKVYETSGIRLRWEIRRVGQAKGDI